MWVFYKRIHAFLYFRWTIFDLFSSEEVVDLFSSEEVVNKTIY
jgi:hypothetical protein